MLSGKLFAEEAVDFVIIEMEFGSRQVFAFRSRWSRPLSQSTQAKLRLRAVRIRKSVYFQRAAGSVLVGEASNSPIKMGTLVKLLRINVKSDSRVALSASDPQMVLPLEGVSSISIINLNLCTYHALKMKSSEKCQ